MSEFEEREAHLRELAEVNRQLRRQLRELAELVSKEAARTTPARPIEPGRGGPR